MNITLDVNDYPFSGRHLFARKTELAQLQ